MFELNCAEVIINCFFKILLNSAETAEEEIMSNRWLNLCLIVFLSVLLNGCMDSNVVVRLKPDGSGTIEETLLMSKAVVEQMSMMMSQMAQTVPDGQGEEQVALPASMPQSAFNLFDEKKLQEKAAKYGEGVTYISGEKVETQTQSGYKAVYAFTDINKIRIKQDPDAGMPQGAVSMAGGDVEKEEKDDALTFCFTKGDPASLVLKQHFEQPSDKAGTSVQAPSSDEEEGEMADEMMPGPMAEMFKGMRMAIFLDLEGDIVETNATHRDGNIITIMEMDFAKILEDPERFKAFSKASPKSVSEARELMKDFPGIKVDLNEELVVKFK